MHKNRKVNPLKLWNLLPVVSSSGSYELPYPFIIKENEIKAVIPAFIRFLKEITEI